MATIVPFPTPSKPPTNITLGNAQLSSSYTSNTWVVPPWVLVDGSFPSLNVGTAGYVGYPFTNFPAPSKPPTNITLANAKGSTSYTANTWLAPPWTFNASAFPSIAMSPYVGYAFENFPVPSKPPSLITDPQSRTSIHYLNNTWGMGTVWGIKEDISRPRLLERGDINDPALTSRKNYVFVEEAEDGSLFYDGKIFKSLRRTVTFDSIVGVNGASVTHVYGGEKLKDSENLPYVFMASGIQDPVYAGGYGDVRVVTERTMTFRTDRSNNAVFYYNKLDLPPYDYLMQISTISGIFHIALFLDNVTDIRVVMHTGEVVTVGLVPIDDLNASPIRVMTKDGLFALESVDI